MAAIRASKLIDQSYGEPSLLAKVRKCLRLHYRVPMLSQTTPILAFPLTYGSSS